MSEQQATCNIIEFFAEDGYTLGGRFYSTTNSSARGKIVLGSAIGVKQEFYRHFARYAQNQGFDVLTFDYRGIGASAPASLKGFTPSALDWAQLDLASAINRIGTLSSDAASANTYLVGHSFGGHALALIPNAKTLDRICMLGCGAGWHGWMPLSERLRVLAYWHLLGPLLGAWKGYVPMSVVGMGEDIPLSLFRQWRRWCKYPNFYFGDPARSDAVTNAAQLTEPLLAISALDDAWALPDSRDALVSGFPHINLTTLDLDPAQVRRKGIGHMGYFKVGMEPLWQWLLDWLDSPTPSLHDQPQFKPAA